MRVRQGHGRDVLLQEVDRCLAAAGAGVGAGAGAGAGISSPVLSPPPPAEADAIQATAAQPELPFPAVLRMCEEVVRHCTLLPAGGVLGSAFKAAYRAMHGRELQLKFLGQRVQLKDILERSEVVERVIVNTQPLYRTRGVSVAL